MIKKQKRLLKKTMIWWLITGVFFILLSTYLILIHRLDQKIGTLISEITNEKNSCKFTRRLDGVCVNKEAKNLWPVAIMIDNHPDAWPQFGIAQANLVYNTLVEGGHTRLMAIFAGQEKIEKIGPVRSARPYYLIWAAELNAIYGHSGGSPEALEKIKEWQILDWNEITSYGPEYFERDYNYETPHNLFTSNEKIAQARVDWELSDKIPEYTPWQFKTNATSTTEVTTIIKIDYTSGSLFDVWYEYNTSTQKYLRFQNEDPYLDGLTEEQVGVKNLIIQIVPEEEHLDAEDRLHIDTLGEGKAIIFYNGKMVQGSWKKKFLEERTIFYDDQNQEIVFEPGNIWVEVVPETREVKIN